MLITFWAALGLLASSGPATAVLSKEAERGRPKVLVLDLIDGTELGEARANALQDAILAGLAGAPVEVISASDLRVLLDQQETVQALGCMRSSCLLDLAGAFQARFIIAGSLASFGERTALTLKLIDADGGDARVLHRESHEALPDALTALARVTAAKMRQAMGGPPPNEAELAVLKAGEVPLFGLSAGILSATGFVTSALIFHRRALEHAGAAISHADDPVAGPMFRERTLSAQRQRNLTLTLSTLIGGVATVLWRRGL